MLDIFGLYNAVMVMSDRATGSVWSHLGGNALDGPLKGAEMDFIPILQTTWERWRELYPDTLVLSDDTPYRRWYAEAPLGAPGMGQGFIRSIVTWDTRLTQNEVVLGVVAGGESVAYPLAVLVELGGVVVDVIGGEPVVVFADAESSLSAAFSRRVGGRVLDFENVSDTGLDIVDEQTGSVWTPDGRAVSGPLEGESLAFVTSFLAEWYGWSAYHPATSIFDPGG